MKLSDSLVKLPEGLIQELIHMKDEGLPGEPGYGFSAPTMSETVLVSCGGLKYLHEASRND